jgi:uracil-DNA glycosylase
MNDPFKHTTGPRDAEVILVGEAWGADEVKAGLPFVGMSGRELDRILFESGIPRNRVLCTNVVDDQPRGNDFTEFLVPGRDKTVPLLRGVRASPKLTRGHSKLLALIDAVKPKLIIGAGGVPLWALTPHGNSKFGGIMNWRGSQTYTEELHGQKYPYLPIVHPAYLLRSWDIRSVLVHDLKARAARFLSGGISWGAPKYASTCDCSFGWAKSKLEAWLRRASTTKLPLAVDIETWRRKYIACIGFADETTELCVPFFYFTEDGGMVHVYTFEQEVVLRDLVRELLSHPNVQVIGQNWIYDYQFILRELGIKVPPFFDTMVAHHLCWPGTPKGLDYLASLYCNYYCFWKNESQDWDDNLGHHLLWRYNCKDVRYTYEVWQQLSQLITRENLSEQYSFQLEQWKLAADMMDRGVRIDLGRRREVAQQLAQHAAALGNWLLDIVPEDTRYTDAGKPWYTSPALTKDIFYRQLGLPQVIHKKTKTLTTGGEALDELRKKAPWTAPIMDRLEQLRSIQVFRSHFIEAGLSSDWRLRCTFYVGGTETFRWSSGSNSFGEGTNLQNIPKGEEK